MTLDSGGFDGHELCAACGHHRKAHATTGDRDDGPCVTCKCPQFVETSVTPPVEPPRSRSRERTINLRTGRTTELRTPPRVCRRCGCLHATAPCPVCTLRGELTG